MSRTQTEPHLIFCRGAPRSEGFHACADTAPEVAGAYILLIDLSSPLPLHLPRRSEVVLEAGRYLYFGSAHGAGGLRARLRRHMRRDKSLHWHVDRLTTQGRVAGAWVFRSAQECELFAGLRRLPPVCPGFGASDCIKGCTSHLRAWRERRG